MADGTMSGTLAETAQGSDLTAELDLLALCSPSSPLARTHPLGFPHTRGSAQAVKATTSG